MILSTQSKVEQLLITIDHLGMATIKNLRGIHDLKSYRNACYVIKKIEPYVNTTFFNKEKVFYLNKQGLSFIDSDKQQVKKSNLEHTLLRNEAYMYLNCPLDWKNECVLEYEVMQPNNLGIVIKGMNVVTKSKMVADAVYKRNGYTHIVEIDNTRHMQDNHKKIKSYVDCFKSLDTPRLEIFTTTLDRKRKFEKWLLEYKLRGEVKVFDEIK
ncbi:hypothetical protein [Bacillus sp. AP8]|uniref:hypothetical protein n=2 Tax=Bacillus TaxID=1386 RepID=UPI00035E50D9|nr:hypothetical protein [Bacillus sp. AP8]